MTEHSDADQATAEAPAEGPPEHPPELMDRLRSLSKQRGFIFQSSEIYGGIGSVYDYGPLGVELKQNIRSAWWEAMVHQRPDIEGLDAGILMNPRVWETSGHVEGYRKGSVPLDLDDAIDWVEVGARR
jgi:hypothetical protein